MKQSLFAVALAALVVSSACGQDSAPPVILELDDALRLALERNPQLRAAEAGVRAAEGRRIQAGALPNPALSAEVEDFGGRDEYQGFDAAQTTVGLEQTVELGGKRAARTGLAGAELKLAERDRELMRCNVLATTTERFVDVLAAQELLGLSLEACRMAELVYQTVSNRVAAGKDAPVEEARARAELMLGRLDLERAGSRVEVSRRSLFAMWAAKAAGTEQVRGDLSKATGNAPDMEAVLEALTRSPGWRRLDDDVLAAECAVSLERSGRIPDLSAGAGIRSAQADDSRTFMASLSIELPVFDRKRGGIIAAGAELERRSAEREAGQLGLTEELKDACAQFIALQKEATVITREALPALEQAFAAAQASYAGGKTGYLDMQDARRLLLEMRGRQIETLAGCRKALVQVERLTGQSPGGLKTK